MEVHLNHLTAQPLGCAVAYMICDKDPAVWEWSVGQM